MTETTEIFNFPPNYLANSRYFLKVFILGKQIGYFRPCPNISEGASWAVGSVALLPMPLKSINQTCRSVAPNSKAKRRQPFNAHNSARM